MVKLKQKFLSARGHFAHLKVRQHADFFKAARAGAGVRGLGLEPQSA
jgi:hypothetical protein